MRLKVNLRSKESFPQKSYVQELLDRLRDYFWFKVLVVEDSAPSRNLLKMAMASLPCTVDFAENGRAALQHLKNNPPYDLVILDQDLPDTQGLRILETIDAQSEWSDKMAKAIPFIVYSGIELRPLREFRNFKFADYIQKPTNITSIHKRIEKVLKMSLNQTGVGQNL